MFKTQVKPRTTGVVSRQSFERRQLWSAKVLLDLLLIITLTIPNVFLKQTNELYHHQVISFAESPG